MKKGYTYPRPVTGSARKRPVSYRLPALFSRCPVCGGTTTIGSYDHGVPSQLNRERPDPYFSVCHSCDTSWDLHGEVICMGSVTSLPHITPHKEDSHY